jgi:hypothetical protein
MDKDEQAGASSSAAAAEEECAITNFAAVRIRHRHSQYTGGQPLLCSRPSDGRTEFIGSVRRNQKPLRWIGLDLPPRPLDAFEKSLSKELSTYTTEVKGDPYDIFHPLGFPPPNTVCIQFAHMLQGIHPLVPRTTRYSSIWPKY